MENVFENWSRQYYMEPLLCILLFITYTVAQKNKTKYSLLKYIPIYIIALLLVYIFGSVYYLVPNTNFYKKFLYALADYFDYFFVLVELIIFSNIYYQLIKNNKLKNAIVFSNVLFGSYFLYMLFRDQKFPLGITENTQTQIYTIEEILLFPLCFFYFVTLYKKTPNVTLKNQPDFWISTGLILFLGCTLPYSILENYFRNNVSELNLTFYTLFYIFYFFHFIMIIKAYLCKPVNHI